MMASQKYSLTWFLRYKAKVICHLANSGDVVVNYLETPGAAIWEATKVTVPIALTCRLQIDICQLVKFHCACPALVWICHLLVGVRCRAARSAHSHAVELLSKLAIYISQNRNLAMRKTWKGCCLSTNLSLVEFSPWCTFNGIYRPQNRQWSGDSFPPSLRFSLCFSGWKSVSLREVFYWSIQTLIFLYCWGW